MPEQALSVVIPAYNSAAILPVLYARLKAVLDTLSPACEIITVDDCSTDGSLAVLAAIARADQRVKVISLRKNAGYDNALLAGLHATTCPLVVTMDDDLQHAPEDIPALLAALRAGDDVIYARFAVKHHSLVKNLGSWFNGKAAELLLAKPAAIYLSPFKLMRRELVAEIIRYTGPTPYIDGLILQTTAAVSQVTVAHHPRWSGRGNYGVLRSVGIWLRLLVNFSLLPLRCATVLGLALSGLALFAIAGLLFWKLYWNIDVEGWASTLVCIMLFSGAQLTMLGIIGEYTGNTQLQINNKPQFTVKTRINC